MTRPLVRAALQRAWQHGRAWWTGRSRRSGTAPPGSRSDRSRPRDPSQVCQEALAFEAWGDGADDPAVLAKTLHRAAMPAWARHLLDAPGPGVDGPAPSSHDLYHGGLLIEVQENPDGNGLWWSASPLSPTLTPEAWPRWAIDGHHRFTVPLTWFVHNGRRGAPERPHPGTVAAVCPEPAWLQRWAQDGHGPFCYTGARRPVYGWRVSPLELAALAERWDCVERWARQAPDLVEPSQRLLIERGLRPWWGEGRWGTQDDANRVIESGPEGAARIGRAWEAVTLRLALGNAPLRERPRARL